MIICVLEASMLIIISIIVGAKWKTSRVFLGQGETSFYIFCFVSTKWSCVRHKSLSHDSVTHELYDFKQVAGLTNVAKIPIFSTKTKT